MNIAVDARELRGKPTGVGTYLAHLLGEWERMPEARAHRWMLYMPGGGRREAEGGSQANERQTEGDGRQAQALGRTPRFADCFEWRAVRGRAGTWWEQRALAAAIRRDRPDVLFAPGYTAPLAITVPVVLTVHDVSFFAHPEWFGRREGLRRRLITRWSARRARTVLTVSEFSKREIVSRLGVPDGRVEVIRHGISRPTAPAADTRPPIVLFVGSIFNRRHVPDLVRAFAPLVPEVPGVRLEIVGDNLTHPREDLDALARTLGVAERVGFRSYVTDQQLALLYAEARVFAFLSEYEGFGLTPLEALAHSVPIVVLDTPVAREVYEDAAIYVRRGDLAGTAAALKRLLLDADARAVQMRNAQRVLDRYCWREAARRTLSALEEAARRERV
jgi:glycosyltransferase involved in cell wall biosynthesis